MGGLARGAFAQAHIALDVPPRRFVPCAAAIGAADVRNPLT